MPSWIRIRIRNLYADPDPDPIAQINADPDPNPNPKPWPNATEENMTKLLELVKTVGKESVLIGDLNLPEVDWETGKATRRSRDLVEALDDQL